MTAEPIPLRPTRHVPGARACLRDNLALLFVVTAARDVVVIGGRAQLDTLAECLAFLDREERREE